MKPQRFRLYFNRNDAKRDARDIWTVCVDKRMLLTPRVIVNVPIETVYLGQMSKCQPRAYLKGKGRVQQLADRVLIEP